ncbi:hypothetical protein JHK82_015885 [Glycine max]|nr:hypothetical protein JHK85_016288 [Glycine max]KAG5046504.1 hypothetical protein JHK86_015910 [Glycine max]KAG5149004.1 hypothetical protein JHK82_015885 [Glycine max]
MWAGHGLRSRTRDSFSRPFRKKGAITLTTYLRTYHVDDYVNDTYRKFSLYLDTDEMDQGDDTYLSVSNVTLGFDVDKYTSLAFGFSKSSLKNVQDAQGTMVIKGNLVVRGLGETQQDYSYTSDGYFYSRKVGSSNYTILYDKIRHSCNKKSHSHLGPHSIKKLFIL